MTPSAFHSVFKAADGSQHSRRTSVVSNTTYTPTTPSSLGPIDQRPSHHRRNTLASGQPDPGSTTLSFGRSPSGPNFGARPPLDESQSNRSLSANMLRSISASTAAAGLTQVLGRSPITVSQSPSAPSALSPRGTSASMAEAGSAITLTEGPLLTHGSGDLREVERLPDESMFIRETPLYDFSSSLSSRFPFVKK